MKVTPDIIRSEFIGTEARIVNSSSQCNIGITGRVIDETRKTFTLLKEGKKKVIIKESSIFHFVFQDGTIVEIDGKLLLGKPEDRLKRRLRRLW